MIILGIDPGSRKTGFAVIRCVQRKLDYIDSGVLSYAHIKNFFDRLCLIHEEAKSLVERYQPQQVAIESLIYVKSVTSLAKLAQARGAMIAAFGSTHKEKIFEYSPNLVKSSVSGHGHADKNSVDRALGLLFGKKKYQTHDESDALAIAVCHALCSGVHPMMKSGMTTGRRSGGLKSALAHHPSVIEKLKEI